MKIFKGLMSAAAVAIMAAQPVVASEAAQKLSLKNAVSSDVRVAGKAGKSKAAAGIPTIFLILGAVAVVAIVVAVSSGDDSPDSP